MAAEVKAYARDVLKREIKKIQRYRGIKLDQIAKSLDLTNVSLSRILNRATGVSPASIKGLTEFVNDNIEGTYVPDELFYYGGADDDDEW